MRTIGGQGSVNDPILKCFSELSENELSENIKSIRIHDWLSMRSGLNFKGVDINPDNIKENNYVEPYLKTTRSLASGKPFKY